MTNDEESFVNPDSYGAERDRVWRDIQDKINASIADKLKTERTLGLRWRPHGYATEEPPDWTKNKLEAENIVAIVPVPDAIGDEYTLSKEEYDAKYPRPKPYKITRRQQLRHKICQLRQRLGTKLGTLIAGERLLTETDWENERGDYDY